MIIRHIRAAALIVAVAAPVISHITLAMGQGYGAGGAAARNGAVALAAIQALATGLLLATSLPTRRWLAAPACLILLLALALGARHSEATALLAMAGTAHALLYTALLLVFASTLRPGRTALVTWLASRLNPTFHPGMIPYTRAVTSAWVMLFAGQLAASATLLMIDVALWQTFVTILHVPLTLLAGGLEALVRKWRWRHEHATSLRDTITGTRALMRRPPSSP